MKIIDAINRIDSLKHNSYSQLDKILWLSELDWDVKLNIIDTHEGQNIAFSGYDDQTDLQTELLIPAPYDKVYLLWLEAQIDYYNGEYDRYNNAMEMYGTAFDSYANYYNRTNKPKGKKFKFF